MQLRLSNGNQSPFQGILPQSIRKNKQQTIFTYNNRDTAPRNVYYDNNPYSLHTSPSEPFIKTHISSSRNSSRSRECTDSNSQRSCKVIRANGLRLVEKPGIARIQEQSPISPISPARINDQTRRFMQREIDLQAENKVLKGENQYLKQKIRIIEQEKKQQTRALGERVQYLLQLTQKLERKIQHSETEWKQQIRKFNYSQLSDM